MIIRIFKISTMEMWTLSNKQALIIFIKRETGIDVPQQLTIKQLIRYLPIENYHRV